MLYPAYQLEGLGQFGPPINVYDHLDANSWTSIHLFRNIRLVVHARYMHGIFTFFLVTGWPRYRIRTSLSVVYE